jgi:hypothetical protein
MNIQEYQHLFEEIIHNLTPNGPYSDADYMNYTKLNHSRSNRWMKNGQILPEVKTQIESISSQQHWVLITEPWCGDAAHNVPFIAKLAELNSLIKLEIQLRDSDSEIDSYLTNGGKAIPKLIIRSEKGEDLAVWGPRPEACQAMFLELKASGKTFEEQKIELQNWYNADKGESIQRELMGVLQSISKKEVHEY